MTYSTDADPLAIEAGQSVDLSRQARPVKSKHQGSRPFQVSPACEVQAPGQLPIEVGQFVDLSRQARPVKSKRQGSRPLQASPACEVQAPGQFPVLAIESDFFASAENVQFEEEVRR